MWDLGGHIASNPPSHTPSRRMPSPAIPVPHHGRSSSVPGSYLPVEPTPYLNPSPDPNSLMPIPRDIPHLTVRHQASHQHLSSHHHHHHHHSSSPAPQRHHHSAVLPVRAPPPPAPPVIHHQPSLSLHPDFRYSNCTGRKKALCIGINYRGQKNELRGCINDARDVRDFLVRHYGYKMEDIVVLTDDSRNPRQQPTRRNMLDAMRWLVRSARSDDSLFFHYSGHGGQTKDLDGDEVDGLDEVIYPVDYQKNGHIVDDDMHSIMVKPLPPGCRLTAVFDSCHSGTALDLPYIYSAHGRLKGSHVSARARARKASPADVISFSGCKDDQTSADTFEGGAAVGAMSYAFIEALTKNPRQSYQELLQSVRHILYPRFSQKPQLGSSHPIHTSLQFIL